MNREQAIAWLTLEGWEPVGRVQPDHWYGIVRADDMVVYRQLPGEYRAVVRHDTRRHWFKICARREWEEGYGDAEVFARYIQEQGL